MKSQKTLFIIFDSQGTCFGEMFFDHDHFTQALLHPEGEVFFGDWLADWQVVGLAHCQKRCTGNKAVCASGEHIPMHSPEFPAALRAWLERHGLYSLVLPEAYWQTWSMIRQLPLLPFEQMRLAQALSHHTPEEAKTFANSLTELLIHLESSVAIELSKTSKPIESLKSAQSIKPTKPSLPKKPTKPIKLSKSSKLAKSTKPIKPPQPTIKPSKSKKPRKSVKPTKSVKKTISKKTVKLYKPSKSPKPLKQSKRKKPTKR